MRVISQKPLALFRMKHPESESSLRRWYLTAKSARWENFAQTRETFPSADQVKLRSKAVATVFNAGGGVRIIAAIHYNRQRLYILRALTHDEYEKGSWKLAL